MQGICIIFSSLAFLSVRFLQALLPACMSATGEHHQLWTMHLKLLSEQGFILPYISSRRSGCQEHLKYILMIQSQLRVTQRKENGSWQQSTAQPLCLLAGDCCEHHPHTPVRQEHHPSWSVTKAFSPTENPIHLETLYSPCQNICL